MGKKYKTTFTNILKSVILKDTHIKKFYKYKSPWPYIKIYGHIKK